jgi:hypothetical protein
VAPINAQFRRLIPAQGALEDALKRVGNRDPVGVAKMLFAAMKTPTTALVAGVNDPLIGSFTAQRMFNAGRGLSRATLGQDANRATILAMLAQQPKQ